MTLYYIPINKVSERKNVEELDRQWYDEDYWKEKYHSYLEWDNLIRKFNGKTGLLKNIDDGSTKPLPIGTY